MGDRRRQPLPHRPHTTIHTRFHQLGRLGYLVRRSKPMGGEPNPKRRRRPNRPGNRADPRNFQRGRDPDRLLARRRLARRRRRPHRHRSRHRSHHRSCVAGESPHPGRRWHRRRRQPNLDDLRRRAEAPTDHPERVKLSQWHCQPFAASECEKTTPSSSCKVITTNPGSTLRRQVLRRYSALQGTRDALARRPTSRSPVSGRVSAEMKRISAAGRHHSLTSAPHLLRSRRRRRGRGCCWCRGAMMWAPIMATSASATGHERPRLREACCATVAPQSTPIESGYRPLLSGSPRTKNMRICRRKRPISIVTSWLRIPVAVLRKPQASTGVFAFLGVLRHSRDRLRRV
jgi:hypothetical protein